ncbi:hypothetical protein JOQ06_005875 [Pogonophryne albipinna]|uniref:Uncharacterized protein n=2 Tax=Pogonophryne albipinna TaxID=1090488 RepID=A0AAD6FRM5_9TELE|nr:hypothetical protein JOQ06_005875 [Pogonophryne albipinna]
MTPVFILTLEGTKQDLTSNTLMPSKGEVMPLETCATQATSPNENIEEMVKNSDCTESYMKTTGPVLSPLSRAEKGLDEVMPLETCGATSPNENIESAIWLKAKYLMNEQYKI